MIVLDASAAVNGILGDGAARQALHDSGLHAPHLIDTEILHAVRRRVLANDVTFDGGQDALSAWQRVAVVRYSGWSFMQRAWELRDNVSAYDATYVALAEALGCPLVTADARLSNAAGIRCAITVLPD